MSKAIGTETQRNSEAPSNEAPSNEARRVADRDKALKVAREVAERNAELMKRLA